MRDSIRNLLSISRLGNQYMQSNKPWVLVKGTPEEKSRAGTVVSLSANIAALLSVLLEPFMPTTSRMIKTQLNIADETFVILDNIATYVKPGHKIGKPSPLFQKLETSLIQELKKKFMSETIKEKSKSPPPTSSPQVGSSDVEIEKLNQMVTEQGLKVRELKMNKAEKSVVDAEVAILIELKRNLAVKQGIDPSTLIGGGKKKGKKK
ncbi:MARS [Acanthosepion pharaonis]|uniref:MARS n=1 Tax=Acanthosepion pharaonis TaxID=158019 RepID=A0A812ELB2_ACAPH|nr:MARS [Sepia pharaonis]